MVSPADALCVWWKQQRSCLHLMLGSAARLEVNRKEACRKVMLLEMPSLCCLLVHKHWCACKCGPADRRAAE